MTIKIIYFKKKTKKTKKVLIHKVNVKNKDNIHKNCI